MLEQDTDALVICGLEEEAGGASSVFIETRHRHGPAILDEIGGDPQVLDQLRRVGSVLQHQRNIVGSRRVAAAHSVFIGFQNNTLPRKLAVAGKEPVLDGGCGDGRHRQQHHRRRGDQGLAQGELAGDPPLGPGQQLIVDAAYGVKQVKFVHK